ncbi:GD16314 [Drosophila simulans]|uniref:GD16314 n=1 Tax=Drosophila simulans TaxID=7240 RepID=B4R491_DROSI|nr:GD16314 [Drosophila simulans]
MDIPVLNTNGHERLASLDKACRRHRPLCRVRRSAGTKVTENSWPRMSRRRG